MSDPFIAAMLTGGTSDAPRITETQAMGLSAIYRGVSLIAGSIGALPLRTLRTNRDGTRERAGSFLDDPGFGRWTVFEWKELAAVHLVLHGNVYAQHVYNGAGALAGLNLIHPCAVQVEDDPDALGGRKYTVDLGDGDRREFDAATLTHVPGLSLDGVKGLSLIDRARLSLGTGQAGDKAAHRMQTNGAMIAGLVTPDADEDLTPEEARVVKDTVRAAMTGVENAGDVAVINRKLKFQPWQLSAVDAQFLATRAFSIEEISRWLGVPPHLLGQIEKQTSWGTGLTEQNRGLARYTLTPHTARIEQRVTRLLSRGRIAEFDYKGFIAPDSETEIRLLLEQVNGGLLLPNEARRVMNLPPVKGGDTLRIPAGAAPPAPPGGAPAGTPDEEAA